MPTIGSPTSSDVGPGAANALTFTMAARCPSRHPALPETYFTCIAMLSVPLSSRGALDERSLAKKARVDFESEVGYSLAGGFELGARHRSRRLRLQTRPTSANAADAPSRARTPRAPRDAAAIRCATRREFSADVHPSRCANGVLRKTGDRRATGSPARRRGP